MTEPCSRTQSDTAVYIFGIKTSGFVIFWGMVLIMCLLSAMQPMEGSFGLKFDSVWVGTHSILLYFTLINMRLVTFFELEIMHGRYIRGASAHIFTPTCI